MARGLLASDAVIAATVLPGGVSNVVLAVTAGDARFVVKQSLARLAVAQEWRATQARTVTEATALDLVRRWTPAHAPVVVDLDTGSLILVITAAPASWRNLRSELLAGKVDETLFRELGNLLARWQSETADRPDLIGGLEAPGAFRQLRTDPFHRAVAAHHPVLAPAVLACVEELETSRSCLVHGDFSPKNILAGADGFWVLDFEVAHAGAPVFDVAFLVTHLVLKAIVRPVQATAYGRAAALFLDAYLGSAPPGLRWEATALARHAACLLLARVDGRSPAAYLESPHRDTVRALGQDLLLRPPEGLAGIFERIRT